MNALLSMTEFVLLHHRKLETSDYSNECSFMSNVVEYANFLSQPLQLGFFVPCDIDGNVLEETNRSTHTNEECKVYNEAKSRVLFEGFVIDNFNTPFSEKDATIVKDNVFNVFWREKESQKWVLSLGISTIEDLVKYNLELTPTAKQQIGL